MATLTSFDNANRADSTLLSIFLFCLCLCGFSAANETWIENATEPREPEMAGASRIPTESRILDGGSSSKPLNFTSFVTIDSKYQVEEDELVDAAAASTTLRCPSSSPESTDFRPSVHIGEIDEYESRKSDYFGKQPFNNRASVNNRIKFGNTVRIDETAVDNDGVRVPTSSSRNGVSIGAGNNKIPVKFFETDGRYSFVVPVDLVHHHQQQQQEHYEPQYLQISGHQQQQDVHTDQAENENDDSESHEPSHHHQHSPVTFEYPGGLPVALYGTPSPHLTLLRPLNSPIIKEPSPVHYQQLHPQQQQQQYTNVPHLAGTVDNFSPVLAKPTKFYDNVVVTPSTSNNPRYQHYQYAPAIASGEAIEKPEIPSFQHPPAAPPANYHSVDNNNNNNNNNQAIFTHDDESHHIGKPDTLYYVTSHHESAVTRMRKFPYKFYDPSLVGQHDDQFHYSLQELQPNYPSKERRVSPWKKIIHLIGAFLPLGLLLATLKPNVVRIENTTQPNIVLSKLRVIDLPAEHKRGRLVEKGGQDECDDRSICELIVSGSQPSSNLLQNILWNFTNRSTEEEAQKHGLREIFAAAKKKDCSLIDC